MTPDHDDLAESEPRVSPGRRTAVRTLAGLGVALMALTGRDQASSARAMGATDGPAGPDSLDVVAAKKGKHKRGPTGPTGPTGPAGTGTINQNEATIMVPDGSNASQQANCLSGQATGGGASLSNTACELVSSNVIGTSAWGGTGRCPMGATALMSVRVICLG